MKTFVSVVKSWRRAAVVKTWRRAVVVVALAAASLAASAVAAWACGWGGFENSVRFGGYGETDRDRSRLPPLPPRVRRAGDVGEAGRREDDERLTDGQRKGETDKLWTDAREAVASGELEKARRLLSDYVVRTNGAACDVWEAPRDCQERRNSAFDQLDALGELARGSRAADVRQYLLARAAYDEWLAATEYRPEDHEDWRPPARAAAEKDRAEKEEARSGGMKNWDEEVETRLSTVERDARLADNAAYLRAVGVYRAGRPGDAAEAFESVAAKYASASRREAALYMAGRVRMTLSKIFLGGATSTSEEPCRDEDCRDEAFHEARKQFGRLLAEYPEGRHASDARGWLAYLDQRVGDTAGALAEYYRLLADADDESGRDTAVRSLRLVRPHADEADMEALEKELEDEPRAALAYAYHNIYSYAPGYYLRVPEVLEENPYKSGSYSSDEYRWTERKERDARGRAERAELRRAAEFAGRMLRRHPNAGAGGAFLVRLAEAQFELNDPRAALATARRALASGLSSDERTQALWVEGTSEYRLRNYEAARRTLARVVEEFPGGELEHPARRLLATVAEDAGDLESALGHYLALGYDPDVAYFVDVLLTPDQLASFVEKNTDAPRRDELLYALGLRMMRAGRYAESRAAFSRVRTSVASYYDTSTAYGYYNPYDDYGQDHPKLNFRQSFWDLYNEGDGEYLTRTDARPDSPDTRVYADWLMRDTKTLDDLERLQGEVERAEGDEAKAEALYQLASYLYEGELVFYNPAAWRGMRAELIRSLDETNYRAPNEAQTIWRYAQEHEGTARALAVYLEVVRRYPKTRAARDSLYTAILCHQELSNFNGYWRDAYARGAHAGERIVSLADLRREYPQYRLPLDGEWKPSTRTVDGGPAWPAPKKPKALTGVERVRAKIRRAERLAADAWDLYGEVYGGRVRRWTVAALRWLLVAVVALGVLVVFRATRRTRRFLYRTLARCCSKARARPAYAPKSSYAAHVSYTRADGLRATAGGAAQALLRLALHERGRAALALNLLTHGLLSVLVWAVLWAAR